MDGAVQTVYPRKNWSSLMLLNCDHSSCEADAGCGEHRDRRLFASHAMGGGRRYRRPAGDLELARRVERKAGDGTPNAVHYTRGGPWFKNWQNVDYGDLWGAERDALERARAAAA